jgi:DNA-binding HxlR family transcriptional regulator
MKKINNSDRRVCPTIEHAFSILGKKWTGLIIHVLAPGARRFSEIPELSPRLLTQRLKELENEGIVRRRVVPESPVRVEYSLTEKGCSLIPIMQSVADWAYTWYEKNQVPKKND